MRTRHPIKDLPGFALLAPTGYSRSEGVLVPDALAREIEAADRAAKAGEASQDSIEALAVEEAAEDAAKTAAEEEVGADHAEDRDTYVQVFEPEVVRQAAKQAEGKDKDFRRRAKLWHDAALRDDGRRRLPTLAPAEVGAILEDLAWEFPNFAEAIDVLQTELVLAAAMPPDAFRVSPLLLNGPPGVGKTLFGERVAEALGLSYEKISVGSSQGAFDLVGTSTHWSNSHPGRIFAVLADQTSAAPVVLIDEIDKMPSGNQYPAEPALLDLLEEHSARRYRDEAAGLAYDASHIVILATCNVVEDVSAPLRSRLHAVEVRNPTTDERRRIAESVFLRLRGRLCGEGVPDMSEAALDRLAAAPVDVRAIIRSIRLSTGAALVSGRCRIGPDDLVMPEGVKPVGRRIGFV